MELGIHFPNFTLPGEPDSLAGALYRLSGPPHRSNPNHQIE